MKRQGFTLIEVLLVVIIISVLTAIVLVAINPARQIAQANNTKRAADVTTILNAVSEYVVENGVLPPSEENSIVIAPRNMSIASTDVDICDALVPTFVAELPYDPSDPDAYFTSCNDYDLKYEISRETDDRITIYAPNAQLGEDIEVTR